MVWGKRVSLEFQLFIGLAILLFSILLLSEGNMKMKHVLRQASLPPLEHILLVFAFPDFGQERLRDPLPDCYSFQMSYSILQWRGEKRRGKKRTKGGGGHVGCQEEQRARM